MNKFLKPSLYRNYFSNFQIFWTPFFLVIFSSYFSNLHAADAQSLIPSITHESCAPEIQEDYNKKIISTIVRVPASMRWEDAAKLTIPVACQNNFKSWLAGLAFNLNLFALEKDTPAEVIESVIPFLEIRTFGKDEYLDLLYVWQEAGSAFYEEEKLRDLFYTALKMNYRAGSIYGATMLYYKFILQGMDHAAAKEKATSNFLDYRSGQDIDFALRKAFEISDFSEPSAQLAKEKLWKRIKDQNKSKLLALKKHIEGQTKPKPSKKFWQKNGKAELPVSADNDLLRIAKSWLSSPYRYGGDSRKGVDTASLVSSIFRERHPEIILPRSVSFLYGLGHSILLQDIQAGDLIFFSYSLQKYPTHVGIYIGEKKFIFSTATGGASLQSIEDLSFAKKIISVKRIF